MTNDCCKPDESENLKFDYVIAENGMPEPFVAVVDEDGDVIEAKEISDDNIRWAIERSEELRSS